ncbi:threonine synthase [Candidatus Desantisbacteria bacterium CG07_land_8_20_14_0_80_39_15]|uniref:Threonine synthase n=2 Tax=unclassified Candidatus Desantisiibacteriota TaxID=3106372 RepID=A0A2H9P995_9BACT|nr:MAG: threonine synthase [Candidatus Desantisbacteria bacterium CG07_land_8_20_14_0_80_39_15]PIZ14766.1 MAG: threonine synthase [Candidatus Desantisbacteria bacterium CG_4_10_14_0_8_um_filter_39_17]
MRWKGVIENYWKYLPVNKKTPVVTLLEGNTPLIEAKNISKYLCSGRVYSANRSSNLDHHNFKIYLKYEGLNPTGSFKDRGMTLAISKAKEEGFKAVICASTGNTSASAAAYAARAGLKCIVLIPKGSIALGKLSQALIHGAQVIAVNGNFDQALEVVREITEKYPVALVNSINPYRIEGQKTASFEICDVLGRAPDFQVMPVGNAGNITAYWKGYKEYKKVGKIKNLPGMCGFQASGAAPIVKGHPIKNPRTVATAIKIGNPASWKFAKQARDESGGLIDTVTDAEIIRAYKLLATLEGVFAEPASAASIAGLIKLCKKGYFAIARHDDREGCIKSSNCLIVVCILTGHGLKDPDRAIASVKAPIVVEPEIDKVMKVIKI